MKSKEIYDKYKIKEFYDLITCLNIEMGFYDRFLYKSKKDLLFGKYKLDFLMAIKKWQKASRQADFYDYKYHCKTHNIFDFFLYFYYIRKRNFLGRKYSLEISTEHIGKGLRIYHFNNIINPNASIGNNLHLHGFNVIGNGGANDLQCPTIGNNVIMGSGAKVIGGVEIADNITIAAGAVVVHSFLEPGITIGGVPAKKIK